MKSAFISWFSTITYHWSRTSTTIERNKIDKTQRQKLLDLLWTNVKKPQFGEIVGIKLLYIKHGGKCMEMKNDKNLILLISKPNNLQCRHEEADTLIALHSRNIYNGDILVRSTDLASLPLLLDLSARTKILANTDDTSMYPSKCYF